jgi:hypothetical protein
VAEGVCRIAGRSSGGERRVYPRFGTFAGAFAINIFINMAEGPECLRFRPVIRQAAGTW